MHVFVSTHVLHLQANSDFNGLTEFGFLKKWFSGVIFCEKWGGEQAFCSSKHFWNFLKKHIVGLQVVFKNESSVLVRHNRGIQSTCACQGVGFDQRLIFSTRAFFREDFKVMMRILRESSTGMLSWIFCDQWPCFSLQSPDTAKWGGVSMQNFTLMNLCFVYPLLWFEVIICSVVYPPLCNRPSPTLYLAATFYCSAWCLAVNTQSEKTYALTCSHFFRKHMLQLIQHAVRRDTQFRHQNSDNSMALRFAVIHTYSNGKRSEKTHISRQRVQFNCELKSFTMQSHFCKHFKLEAKDEKNHLDMA